MAHDAVKYLLEALERDIYGARTPEQKLRVFLEKLNIKSARESSLGTFQVESLEATLRQVKFDMKELKKWKV